ncbi:MAG: fluoride efflux transporter CrcB [Desulfovibrio sp.]|nr:fluoride efflux transporter CrcB [Desulfovibrio sp.]
MIEVLAVCSGACLGALGRWGLGALLNALFPALPPGTLAANWLGSFLMGIFMGASLLAPRIPAQWRLFIVTGFLGSLTTFSAFAGEMTRLAAAGRFGLFSLGVVAHVAGSLLMVFLGMRLVAILAKSFVRL